MKNNQIHNIILNEAKEAGMNQKKISNHLGKQDQNLWKHIRNGSLKFNVLVKICDFIGLEIVIRNNEKNCEYIINKKSKKS